MLGDKCEYLKIPCIGPWAYTCIPHLAIFRGLISISFGGPSVQKRAQRECRAENTVKKQEKTRLRLQL